MKIKLTSLFVFIFIKVWSLIINVPDDFATIQEAIDQSVAGDTVLVAPGTYFENINFFGKNILLSSHFLSENNYSFIEQTIINGSTTVATDTTSTVVFCNSETADAVLQGFTITGGGGTAWIDPQLPSMTWFSGGGIFMYYTSPTIRFNCITENIVENNNNYNGASGGGLLTFRGNPFIHNNRISLNQADYGAGLVTDYSGALIKNNLIIDNSGGSQYGGGGFYSIGTDTNPIILENNTIFGNHSETTGGGIQMWSSSITALNNIIWGNTQNTGGTIHGSGATITYSCVEDGFTGEGNIDHDPLLENEENFILSSTSPCIDAGNPNTTYYDPEDPNNPGFALYPARGYVINDMGVYGGHLSTCFQSTSVENYSVPKFEINLSNFPNPFNPSTEIRFQISDPRQNENAKIEIYNLKGQKIRQYSILNIQSSIVWDGKDNNNKQVSSGIYFVRLEAGDQQLSRKMLLLR